MSWFHCTSLHLILLASRTCSESKWQCHFISMTEGNREMLISVITETSSMKQINELLWHLILPCCDIQAIQRRHTAEPGQNLWLWSTENLSASIGASEQALKSTQSHAMTGTQNPERELSFCAYICACPQQSSYSWEKHSPSEKHSVARVSVLHQRFFDLNSHCNRKWEKGTKIKCRLHIKMNSHLQY